MRIRRLYHVGIAVAWALFGGGILTPAATADPPDSPSVPLMQKLTHEFDLIPNMLSAAKGHAEGDRDPLKTISRRMTVIHGDLSQFETDQPVQTRERQVVQSLDQLIAALERHCNGLGRGNRPNHGRKDSVIANGDPAFGDLHGVNPNARQWSQLPPKLRNQILQSKTDGFPAGYEALLQSYYQQLSEEKSLEDKPAGSPSAPSRPASQSQPADSKPALP
jgi:hypothetical protein